GGKPVLQSDAQRIGEERHYHVGLHAMFKLMKEGANARHLRPLRFASAVCSGPTTQSGLPPSSWCAADNVRPAVPFFESGLVEREGERLARNFLPGFRKSDAHEAERASGFGFGGDDP